MLKKKDNNLELLITNITQILMTKLILIFTIILPNDLKTVFKKEVSLKRKFVTK